VACERVKPTYNCIVITAFHQKKYSNCFFLHFVKQMPCLFNVSNKPYSYFFFFLYFVDRASRYICVMKTNLMHYLSLVYFVSQPLHVSGIFVAHYQRYTVYVQLVRVALKRGMFQIT
jgi:hypothetical protein